MTETVAIELVRETLYYALLISTPILLIGMIIGLAISIFQAVTQIQEQTLTFVPKIFGMLLIVVLLTPWLMNKIMEFSTRMFGYNLFN